MAGADKSIVVLPFADYSEADDLESAYRRNLYVSENLTDQLVSNSFHLPVQEDVFLYLVGQNIVNLIAYDDTKTTHLQQEMDAEWSALMKTQLQRYIDQTKNFSGDQPAVESPGTHGLTQQEVVKIGRHFGADYILRGRIIEYKTREDPSWNPLKRGILTFVNGTTSKLAFGNAASDQYDLVGSMISGAVWGGILGSNANWPWDKDGGTEILGFSGTDDANTVFWGAVGGYAGRVGHDSKNTQAVVQLRIWVQDAYTGSVVWTNRVDVKVSPESVLADSQYDALFETATEKAISTLINDFVAQAM
jgi:TolB-like protein